MDLVYKKYGRGFSEKFVAFYVIEYLAYFLYACSDGAKFVEFSVKRLCDNVS